MSIWQNYPEDITEEQKIYWKSQIVQEYLSDVLEEHYPKLKCPRWVNRELFEFDMASLIFGVLWEILEDDLADFGSEVKYRDCFYFTNHLFGYISEQINIGDLERNIEELREIHITEEVWEEFFKNKGMVVKKERKLEKVQSVKKAVFDPVEIWRKLLKLPQPKWYVLEKDLVRDDVYDEMKKMFPEELKNVGWNEFWEGLYPFICKEDFADMYIRLEDIWHL